MVCNNIQDQHIVSDPSIVCHPEYYFSLKRRSPDDWQQQMMMKTTPINLQSLDHRSDRLNSTISYTRPLPLMDNYNLYYIDTDSVWTSTGIFTSIINTISISTATSAKKTELEPDCLMTDGALNDVSTKALVDPWQTWFP